MPGRVGVQQGSTSRIAGHVLWITGVAILISLMGSSLKNTVQVFFVPMADSFGYPRGEFAIATTIFAATIALASPAIGALSDRFGPLLVMRAGLVVSAAMFALITVAQSFLLLAILYGVLGALGYASLSYVPIGVLVDRAFPADRRGFFYALVTNGTAIGFIVLVPLWIWLETMTSWQSVLIALSVLFAVVLLPLSFTVRAPDAKRLATTATSHVERSRALAVMRCGPFIPLVLAFMACGVTMAFVDVHLIPDMHDHGVAPTTVSTAMVLLGFTEIVGAFVAGFFCDRGRIRSVLLSAYLLRGASIVLLAISPNDVVIQLFGVIFGSSYLMTVVATTVWIARLYPPHVRGLLLGIMWAAHQVGAALSSQLGATLHDVLDSYDPIIYIGAAFCVVSIIIVAALREPAPSIAAPMDTAVETSPSPSTIE
ncbi:MFS transporter [Leifsonia sp. McL0607]|uniref:MFS transporter n=1 Tax=Leifsonia sp. McL0607 TaxID=3415672 RepID=UPI003CE6C296